MKYCKNCGTVADDSLVVCSVCGSEFGAPQPIDLDGGVGAPPPVRPEAPMGAGVVAPPPVRPEAPMGAGVGTPPPVRPESPMGAGVGTPPPVRPVGQLNTKRGLLKYLLLSLITFGIYGIVAMSKVSTDINVIASRYDGKKTMHYCLVYFLFSWLSFGIVPIVWYHKVSARIGNEIDRRGIDYSFGAGSYWGWNVLGAFIIVGPFIYLYKLFKSMNLISEHYNIYG